MTGLERICMMDIVLRVLRVSEEIKPAIESESSFSFYSS